MSRGSPILIVYEHDGLRAARRFVALLWLAEFYTLFVSSGEQYWKAGDKFWVDKLSPALTSEWTLLPLFIGSFVFYLCGRGLWVGCDHWRRWLWVGAVGLAAIMAIEVYTVIDLAKVKAAMGLGEDYDRPTLETFQNAFRAIALHLPIWLSLLVLLVAERRRAGVTVPRRSPWVICAFIYCLCWVPTVMYESGFSRARFDWAIENLTNAPFGKFYTVTLHVGLLLILAWSLYSRRKIARSFALILVTVNSVILLEEWQLLRGLVSSSHTALFHRVPFSTPVEQKILLTSHDLFLLAVYPFRYIFPWLLIAIYAWRVPMWAPVDDGTPYPRAYCAKCLYNLHGNKEDRCPECGSDLGMQSQSVTVG